MMKGVMIVIMLMTIVMMRLVTGEYGDDNDDSHLDRAYG